jgi:RNA polymerase sigma-70 factor (ECF subfamily)
VEEGELTAAAPAGCVSNTEPSADQNQVTGSRSQADSKRRARISALMAAYGEAILGFCIRMVHDEPTAHDLLQQTFMQAYRDLDQFEGRASVRTWLTSIARNRCLDALKHDHRLRKRIESNEQAILEHLDPGAGPEERIDRVRLIAALEQCVRQLPESMRATVLERFVTGFTYEELARSLDAAAKTLQVRVARALRLLKECLEKHGWTYE